MSDNPPQRTFTSRPSTDVNMWLVVNCQIYNVARSGPGYMIIVADEFNETGIASSCVSVDYRKYIKRREIKSVTRESAMHWRVDFYEESK
ncbi:hypothetical protein KOR42_05720 [Thalassoglobus neptunius]|uniref:Uncharacterized protein n=1 Tax=Thalassoglobus neptunius TaxID=1938619 RepID=A0A5C5X258_9PLAN|nr:hypothetical protein [Thalassoglobus neptunius]TWT57214.1 hypothetical protein KOR42_05720 [Thalassoglobus neptunius]